MPFLPPNQQRQSTEGLTTHIPRSLIRTEFDAVHLLGWLSSRVVSVLDLGKEGRGTEGPGFKSQPRRCRVVLGKLFTPFVPLFTKQRNW